MPGCCVIHFNNVRENNGASCSLLRKSSCKNTKHKTYGSSVKTSIERTIFPLPTAAPKVILPAAPRQLPTQLFAWTSNMDHENTIMSVFRVFTIFNCCEKSNYWCLKTSLLSHVALLLKIFLKQFDWGISSIREICCIENFFCLHPKDILIGESHLT